MKTPHPRTVDPYQNRTIFAEEESLIMTGYDFLGWNPLTVTSPKLQHCMRQGHNYHSAFPNAWHSKQHNSRGSDVTQWCMICKIYWKVDMSD